MKMFKIKHIQETFTSTIIIKTAKILSMYLRYNLDFVMLELLKIFLQCILKKLAKWVPEGIHCNPIHLLVYLCICIPQGWPYDVPKTSRT